MVADRRLDDDTVLDQYPGFDLSISELCHALKIKLTQTKDSRYVQTTTQPLLSTTDSAHYPRLPLPISLVRIL